MKGQMYLSEKGKDIIKQGLRLNLSAYINENREPAIGYGITRYPEGLLPTASGNVRIGDKVDKHDADALFDSQMSLYEECVNNFVKVPMSQNQFDALVFNCYKNGIESFLLHPALSELNNFEYRKAINMIMERPSNKLERTSLNQKETNAMESIYALFVS